MAETNCRRTRLYQFASDQRLGPLKPAAFSVAPALRLSRHIPAGQRNVAINPVILL